MKTVALMLKAIHAQESKEAAREKAIQVAEKLRAMKLAKAAKKVEDGIEETLAYMDFPTQHWTRIRTNNAIERLNREIKRRTKAIGAFPDGQSALMLVCARLRHVAATSWGARRYMNMDHLFKPEEDQLSDIIAGWLPAAKRLGLDFAKNYWHYHLKENNVKVKDGTDVNSIMRDMMSIILEGALDQEMDEELGYSKYDYRNKETDNSRNEYSQKTMHTSYGDMEIEIPRDRKGEFEPQIVKKYQNTVTQDMEEKIISMYAKGMTTNDIESHMRELYDIEISDSTISRITDKILPIVKEWQERPLEEIYAVVFMDAIHYHVRNEGRIVKRAVYIAIGIDMEGYKCLWYTKFTEKKRQNSLKKAREIP